MKIKCGNCGLEDIGRYKKLVKRGWKIFFLFDKANVIRCKKCKPNFKDKIKMKIDKDYKPEMYYGIKEQITKLKILKSLKTKEELEKELIKRFTKKRKFNYHYQRHLHKKKGSKSMGNLSVGVD